jgi:hypothetical protein
LGWRSAHCDEETKTDMMLIAVLTRASREGQAAFRFGTGYYWSPFEGWAGYLKRRFATVPNRLCSPMLQHKLKPPITMLRRHLDGVASVAEDFGRMSARLIPKACRPA